MSRFLKVWETSVRWEGRVVTHVGGPSRRIVTNSQKYLKSRVEVKGYQSPTSTFKGKRLVSKRERPLARSETPIDPQGSGE